MQVFMIIVMFMMALAIIELVLYSYRNIRHADRNTVKKRLTQLSRTPSTSQQIPDITKKRILSEIPIVNQILYKLSFVDKLEKMRRQANVKYPLGFYLLLTPLLGVAGFFIAKAIFPLNGPLHLTGCLLSALPLFWLSHQRKKRMKKFLRQLPEALDLVARALKAGHPFTSGIKMIAEQFEDPLGLEFKEMFDEITFGADIHGALQSLAERIECSDIKYFVVSVSLQRETGGNLAEIIEKIAHLIRERFKFHGKVKALTAEGKMSAYVLIALPFGVGFMINIINPDYIRVLLDNPWGMKMIYAAGILMFFGILTIRKMIQIRI